MLSFSNAPSVAVLLSVIVAVLEGSLRGDECARVLKTARFPRYSAPLWVWSIIGVMYYAIFGFLVFRFLSAVPPSFLARATH